MSTETRYHNVSLDSDHDLSGRDLVVALTPDLTDAVTAAHITPPPSAGDLPLPAEGFTRYWWRVLVGAGQPLDPTGKPDPLTLYGRLTDTPEVLYPQWVLGGTTPDAPPPLTDGCWPVVVPANAVTEWATLTGEVRAYAEALAVQTLRALTAGVIGGCPVTVYPCRSLCYGTNTGPTYRTFPVTGAGPGRGGVWPVLDSGTWLNIGCGACNRCGYGRGAIRLVGAVEVVEVAIDGEPLPSTAYYLQAGYLHRADGTPWPTSSNRNGARGFSVTYYDRPRVDGLGALAAGALAVEFARSMTPGAKCALPSRARSVTRNNVSLDLATAADLFPEGRTGVDTADLWVRSINPNRLTVPPAVWSPDL